MLHAQTRYYANMSQKWASDHPHKMKTLLILRIFIEKDYITIL